MHNLTKKKMTTKSKMPKTRNMGLSSPLGKARRSINSKLPLLVEYKWRFLDNWLHACQQTSYPDNLKSEILPFEHPISFQRRPTFSC